MAKNCNTSPFYLQGNSPTIQNQVAIIERFLKKQLPNYAVITISLNGVDIPKDEFGNVDLSIETIKGDKGDKGDPGEKGDKGDKGDPGINGIDGKDGEDGADGIDGSDGADGKSAYEIWLEQGHTGTVEDFFDWLRGNKVTKFYNSIEELEIGEIGEYQGETNATFTHGYFYERGEGGVTIKYGETHTDTFSEDIYFTRNNVEVARHAYVDTIRFNHSYLREARNPNVTCIFFEKDYFYSDLLIDYNSSAYLFPYAFVRDTNEYDMQNPISVIAGIVYYNNQELQFNSYERGDANLPISIDKTTGYKFMWLICSNGWRYAFGFSSDEKCAYIDRLCIYHAVNDWNIERVEPYSITYRDYTFEIGATIQRIDVQPQSDNKQYWDEY